MYPIAAVSKLTGVGCHSLRVWERRYGFPVPNRTGPGHRRYSQAQVALLLQLADRIKAGGSIGELIAEFRRNGMMESMSNGQDVPVRSAPSDREPKWGGFLELLIAGEVERGHEAFDALADRLDLETLLVEVVSPALTETGERWFQKQCSIYQERVVSGFLRRKLGDLTEQSRRTSPHDGPTVIIGTVQGERHEGGVLILDLFLRRSGWRVINLGVDLPVEQYRKAIDQLRPDALALSFVLSRSINKRFEELSKIRAVPVFVGGRSILNYQALARKYGLIPLAGPAEVAIPTLLAEYQRGRNNPA